MAQEIPYSWVQDRLREWRAGTLSDQDRQQLEEWSRRDPFVADALEGYMAHPGQTHDAHLEALERKIRLQKRERRRWLMPNLTVTAIAASLMIIIGFWAVYNRLANASEKNIADSGSSHELSIGGTDDSTVLYSPSAGEFAQNEETISSTTKQLPEETNGYASAPPARNKRTESDPQKPESKDMPVSRSDKMIEAIRTPGAKEKTQPDAGLSKSSEDKSVLSDDKNSINRESSLTAGESLSDFLKRESKFQLSPEISSSKHIVIIQFIVRENGQASNITFIKKSESVPMDEEVLRLVTQYRDWKCIDSSSCLKEFSFYFR